MQKLLEVSIVARRLNCSNSTVLRMLQDPDCPLRAVRLTRKTLRVIEESIDEVLKIDAYASTASDDSGWLYK